MSGNKRRGMVIQPRDEQLLRELSVMRIVDREQAKVIAGFNSTTRANARLLALYLEGLLRRFFQGTIAGGKKAFYALSKKGARLVGAPYQRFRHRDDELILTNLFVLHQYWVNWVYCWAKYQSILLPDVKFLRWDSFSEAVAPSLIPDGYFEISTSQGVIAAFVEVDLGNEGSAVWKDKVEKYLRYAASGDFEKRFKQSRFRVLVIANTDTRAQAIREVVRRSTDKIFWFSSFEEICRQAFWRAVWFRPVENTLRTLF